MPNYSAFKNRTGLSTACFYPAYIEEAFDLVLQLNFDRCELFINTISETKIEFLKEFKQNGSEMNFTAIHPYFSAYEHTLFFSGYRRRFEDSLDLYKIFFETAQFLGAKYVVLHGPNNKNDYDIHFYYDIYSEINETAKKYNVLLCQENVGADIPFIAALSAEAEQCRGEIHYVFDLKHALIRGADPVGMIDAMAGNIKHIHLNDYFFDGTLSRKNCRLPFFGAYDYNLMFAKLLTYNYIGSFIIEVYRENYGCLEDIELSVKKIENFIQPK